MAIAEYREFFFRFVQKTTGASPDKETTFPVKEIVIDSEGTPSQEFNRFLKKHFPSENVYKKLFESLTFKLNSEDTATRDQQGLVRIAIGENVVNRTDIDENIVNGTSRKFTTVVVPSTLPKVSAGVGITVNTLIRRVSDDAIVGSITPGDRELYYIDYEVVNSAPSGDNVGNYFRVKLVDPATLAVDPNDADLIDLGSHAVPANELITNNDLLEYKLLWFDNVGANSDGELQIYVGTSTDINSCYQILGYQYQNALVQANENVGEFVVDIARDDINGLISTIRSTIYKVPGGLQTTPGSNPKRNSIPMSRMYHTATDELVEDSRQLVFNASHNDPLLDWSQIMYVHFRLKMFGGVVGDFAHNRFNIIGKSLKDA